MTFPYMVSGQNGTERYTLKFWEEAKENRHRSEKNGTPSFDTVLMVQVLVPGVSFLSVPTHEVERRDEENKVISKNEIIYKRYAKEIAECKAAEGGENMAGTPLSQLTFISVGQRALLNLHHIHSAEQFVTVPDSVLDQLGMGARTLRKQTQAWLDEAKGQAPLAALVASNEASNHRIAELEKQLQAALPRLAELEAKEAAANPTAPQPTPRARRSEAA